MLRIVLFSWSAPRSGWDYGPRAINRLARQIGPNLSIPHEIVCVGDTAEGLDPSIRFVPLWPHFREMGRCYVRLRAFAPEMREEIGPRFAWIDTDAIVLGDLTPLLDRPEPLVLWDGSILDGQPVNGSIVLMDAGAAADVWTFFRGQESAELARHAGYRGSDQAWIAYALRGRRCATWTAADGVLHWGASAGRRAPPPGARLMFFPGIHKPDDGRVARATPWVAERWAALDSEEPCPSISPTSSRKPRPSRPSSRRGYRPKPGASRSGRSSRSRFRARCRRPCARIATPET